VSQFVYLFRATEAARDAAMGTPARAQRSLERYLAWIRELQAGGHLAHPGQPLEPIGTVVRKDEVVTDGPYVEAKDIVLGFIVVEARDLAHAIALTAGCPILDDGSIEVRPVAIH